MEIMSEIGEIQSAEVQPKSPRQLRSEKLHRAILAGFSEEEKEEFQKREWEKTAAGAPKIDQLGLSPKTRNAFYRFGAQTVSGIDELVSRGTKPYQAGPRALTEVRAKLKAYQENNPPKPQS